MTAYPLPPSQAHRARRVRPRRRSALVAIAMSVVVLASVAAATLAEPPTPSRRYAGTLTPVTLPLSRADAVARPTLQPATPVNPPAALVDPGVPPLPTAAPRTQPAVPARVVEKAPALRASRTGHVLSGRASWYCNSDASRAQLSSCHSAYPDTGGFNPYAAAGPKLRAALGSGWRGRVVSVDGVAVKLVDWCQCYEGQANEKVIDLYYDVYRRAGGSVTIRW